MNPITNMKNLNKMNDRELEMGLAGTKQSWHYEYKDSAWVFIGGLPYELTGKYNSVHLCSMQIYKLMWESLIWPLYPVVSLTNLAVLIFRGRCDLRIQPVR